MKLSEHRSEAPRDEKAVSLRCFQEEWMDLSATVFYLVFGSTHPTHLHISILHNPTYSGAATQALTNWICGPLTQYNTILARLQITLQTFRPTNAQRRQQTGRKDSRQSTL